MKQGTYYSAKTTREDKGIQMHYFYNSEASPFDEPPIVEELSLDALVEAIKKGTPLPPSLAASQSKGRRSRRTNGDESISELLAQAFSRREQKVQKQRKSSKRRSATRRKKTEEVRKERTNRSNAMIEIPEQIGVEKARKSRDTNRGPSICQRNTELNLCLGDIASFDDEDDLSTQGTSLEYYLRGEWIANDYIISPCSNETGVPVRFDASDEEDKHDQACALFEGDLNSLFCHPLPLSSFKGKPFPIPVKWKEYTSLGAECSARRHSRKGDLEDGNDDDGINQHYTCADQSNFFLPVETLSEMFENFFEGPNHNRTRKNRKKRVSSESLSCSSESKEDSARNYVFRTKATSE
jgi:hypothetical protein